MLRGLVEGFFLVTQNAKVKMRLREIRLHPQRFGKFRSGIQRIGFLRQHPAEIVMQFRALRLQFDRPAQLEPQRDRKSTRLNSSHQIISYAVFCLKKKNNNTKSTNATTHKVYTV